MCGRFAITLPDEAMANLFDAAPANDLPDVPNFNVCPTTQVHVVTGGGDTLYGNVGDDTAFGGTAGDTVYAKAGTYDDGLVLIANSGTATDPIVFSAFPGDDGRPSRKAWSALRLCDFATLLPGNLAL